MTVSVRNLLLLILLGLSVLVLAGFVWFAVVVARMDVNLDAMSILSESRMLFWRLKVTSAAVPWRIAALSSIGVVAIVSQGVILRLFRRSSSATMLFLALFFASLILDLGKVAYYHYLSQGMTPIRLIILSRTVRFGHFYGLFALLTSSLYHAGVDYPKTGSVALVIAVVTATLVYLLPIDSLSIEPHLVHSAGAQNSLQAVGVVIGLVVVANGVLAAVQRPENHLWLLSVAYLLLVVGRELVFFLPTPVLTFLGIGALVGGATLAIYRTRQLVLWQ